VRWFDCSKGKWTEWSEKSTSFALALNQPKKKLD
jgi:hypothetical protein